MQKLRRTARAETKSRKGIWIALILLPIGLVVLGEPEPLGNI